MLENLAAIYLQSHRDNQVGNTGNLGNMYIFSAIAFFILLIASVNFINLSTARASVRAKEVAVKRVVGAARKQMIAQFLTESFLMTGFALIIAVLLAFFLLPSFDKFSGRELFIDLSTPIHITVLSMLFLGIGLLSGCYPAFVLSGFQPATTLKGKIHIPPYNLGIRKRLVVFQFAVSVVLIICSTVVYTQMNFLQHHELGFTPSQTVVINFEGDVHVKKRLVYIKDRLLSVPGILNVTASSNVPGDGSSGGWSMDFAKKNGDTIHTELPVYLTDYSYLQQYHIPMAAGRALSQQYAADSVESMLNNETALRKLGFQNAEEVIGVHVEMYHTAGVVTGVFRDFHFESLQKQIEPLAIRMLPSQFRVLSVEVSTANVKQTISAIVKLWRDHGA